MRPEFTQLLFFILHINNITLGVVQVKEKTSRNAHTAFAEEAKASQRLLVFAEKAEEEGLPQIAHLFRAVSAAEGVHSRRHFSLLEVVADTESNLQQAFRSETAVSGVHYLNMLKEAEEEREESAASVFSQARDVEAEHALLYKKALDHLIAQRSVKYFVCTVCGHISERAPPEKCPICSAPKLRFRSVD